MVNWAISPHKDNIIKALSVSLLVLPLASWEAAADSSFSNTESFYAGGNATSNHPQIGNSELTQFLKDYRQGLYAGGSLQSSLNGKYFPSVSPPLTSPLSDAIAIFLSKKIGDDVSRNNITKIIRSLDGSCWPVSGLDTDVFACKLDIRDYQIGSAGNSSSSLYKIVSGVNFRVEIYMRFMGAADTRTLARMTIVIDPVTYADGLERYQPVCSLQIQ